MNGCSCRPPAITHNIPTAPRSRRRVSPGPNPLGGSARASPRRRPPGRSNVTLLPRHAHVGRFNRLGNPCSHRFRSRRTCGSPQPLRQRRRAANLISGDATVTCRRPVHGPGDRSPLDEGGVRAGVDVSRNRRCLRRETRPARGRRHRTTQRVERDLPLRRLWCAEPGRF